MKNEKRIKVLKFGGGCLTEPAAVVHADSIISHYREKGDIVFAVFSALGKTTDHLAKALLHFKEGKETMAKRLLTEVASNHCAFVKRLFNLSNCKNSEFEAICVTNTIVDEMTKISHIRDFAEAEDKFISRGETSMLTIMHEYFHLKVLKDVYFPAADYIVADKTFGDANVDLPATMQNLQILMEERPDKTLFITEGFIAGSKGSVVTLGREGSDYTAAILYHCLKALKYEGKETIVYKKTNGVFSADPHLYEDARHYKKMNYLDALHLALITGAKVVHPKALSLLSKTKGARLIVQNFDDPFNPQKRTVIS